MFHNQAMPPKPKATRASKARATTKPPAPAKARRSASRSAPRPQDQSIINVSLPLELVEAYKEMAATRTLKQGVNVPSRALHDEAVSSFLSDIEAGKKVLFSPMPKGNVSQKSIRLQPETLAELRAVADRYNIQYAHLVYSALIQYMAKRGITFSGFPASFGGR